MKTERKVDSKAEHEVNRFLNDCFYSKLDPSYQTISALDEQILGTDTKFIYNNRLISVDEKCQIERLNQKIYTQCLELGFVNRAGRYQNGWFIKENNTEFYLFTWISECSVNNKSNLTYESINKMEAILVSKDSIKAHLQSEFNMTANDLHRQAVKMLNKEHDEEKTQYATTRYLYFKDSNGRCIYKRAHVTMSLGKIEKPINLVVYMQEYEKICEDHFIITRDSIYSTKKGAYICQAQKN